MKLHVERAAAGGTVTGYGPGWFEVDRVRHSGAMLLSVEGGPQPWVGHGLRELVADDFEPVAALDPEIVLFGSGSRHGFAPPAAVAPLLARQIGVESMDSAAACRTYNILQAEGRRVVLALLPLESAASADPTDPAT